MRTMSQNGRWARLTIAAAIASFGTLAVSPAWAHHSAAMFDHSKTVEMKGVVKTWLYTNPHSFLTVSVKNAVGVAQDYSFEANGPGYLSRNGWQRNSVKVGDSVSVVMNPMRDGSAGGNLVEVTLTDGRRLSASVRRTPPVSP